MIDKILKSYVYEGFGFPVTLGGVPARKIRGEWTPMINYSELARSVLKYLCFIQEPLTGNQIFFMRQMIRLTGEKLAGVLGVTQAAVSKWESKGNEIAKVEPAIEFCLRFIALENLEKDSSHCLRALFLEKHLLAHIKEKQKDATHIPSQVKLKNENYACT